MPGVDDVNGAAMLDLVERLGGSGPWDLPSKTAVGPFVWGVLAPGTGAGDFSLKADTYAVDPQWLQIGGSASNPQIKMIVIGHRLVLCDHDAETDEAIAKFEASSYIEQINGTATKRQRIWSSLASYPSQVSNTATATRSALRKGGVYRYPAPWLLDFNRDQTIRLVTPASALTGTRKAYFTLYGLAFPNDWDLPSEQINSNHIRAIASSNHGFLVPNHEIF